MWAKIKGWLVAGLSTSLHKAVDGLGTLEEPIRALIAQYGPDAASKIITMFQDWARALIDRNIK